MCHRKAKSECIPPCAAFHPLSSNRPKPACKSRMRGSVMPFHRLVKRVIGGLTLASLMFQVALVAAHLSLLTASKADPLTNLPSGIICGEHGPSNLTPEEAPTNYPPSSCVLCCLTFGADHVVIPSAATFSLIELPSELVDFDFNGISVTHLRRT
jgi:hypothetical protein